MDSRWEAESLGTDSAARSLDVDRWKLEGAAIGALAVHDEGATLDHRSPRLDLGIDRGSQREPCRQPPLDPFLVYVDVEQAQVTQARCGVGGEMTVTTG